MTGQNQSGILTVGIIGAGAIGSVHARSWRALGVPNRIWSPSGAEALTEFHGPMSARSVEELIDSVDILDICTPTHTHAEYVLRGIRAGKHVICEKPIARTTPEALRLAAAAAASGVAVYPGHVVRYFPDYVALKTAVEERQIGTPTRLHFRRQGQTPARDWFFDAQLSGGIILDLLIHDIDQARWHAGPVTAVSASQTPLTIGNVVPRTVSAAVVLTHDDGATSFVHGAWGPEGCKFATEFDVVTTAGRKQYDSRRSASDGGRPTAQMEHNPYTVQLAEFAAACAGGPEPRVTLRDGIVAVALAEAAIRSATTGEPVPFDETALFTVDGVPR